MPVGDGYVLEGDSWAGGDGDAGPVLVDVERVGVAVADEVVEKDVGDGSRAAVGFDHVHLIRVPCVDVAVGDV